MKKVGSNTMKNILKIKPNTLLLIAGVVWLIAGFNVTRLGIIAYGELSKVGVVHILLSLVVFSIFGLMFYKMSIKHTKRIKTYTEPRGFWHFFDIKAYLIMTFMMSGGIWLRSSGLAPTVFIAVFYTGLGIALAMAGVFFWCIYISNI